MSKTDNQRNSDIASGWDANAVRWSDAVRQNRIASRVAGTSRAIVEAIIAQAPCRIADIGCGEGWLVRKMRNECQCDIVGFDGSARLIDLARIADPDGTYVVRTYREITDDPGILGGGFDVIVCNFSLFEESLAPLLRSLAASFAANGRIVIQTLHPLSVDGGHYRDGWREETFSAFGDQPWAPMRWYFRTISSWIGLIHESGFSIDACREPLCPDTARPLSLIWMLRTI